MAFFIETPYTVQVWFPTGEVVFQDSFWFFDTDGLIYPEPALWQIWYLIIPPDGLFGKGFTLDWNWYDWEFSLYAYGIQEFWPVTSWFYLV